MTVREILSRCRTAPTEIEAIKRQIDRLMTTGAPGGGTSSANIRRGKIPGKDEYIAVGNTNHPQAAQMQAAEGCMAVLEKKRAELEAMLDELEKLLAMLGDGKARVILRYYYAVGWTDETIADELGMARQTVTTKRNRAINFLETVMPNVTKSC